MIILLGWTTNILAQFVPLNTGTGPINRRDNIGNTNNNPFPSTNDSDGRDTLPKGIIFDYEVIPDSTLLNSVYYFYLKPLEAKIYYAFHPTIQPDYIEQSDYLFAFNNNYYLNTGNVGSPHISLYPKCDNDIAYRYKKTVFDGYGYSLNNLTFYQTERPYTVLSFYNSLESDYQVRVIHTQNITQRWNVALHYDLINSEGTYSNQKTLNNYLGVTTNYYSKNLRYQIKGGVIWKKLNIQENGGIISDSVFIENIQTNRSGIPVNMYTASNKYNNYTVVAHQSYNMAKKIGTFVITDTIVSENDSTSFIINCDTTVRKGSPFNRGVLVHQISFDKHKRNFYHTGIDPLYYPNIYVDSTNTFDSVSHSKLENILFWSNDAYKDYEYLNPLKLSLGVRHVFAQRCLTDNYSMPQYPATVYNMNQLIPFAKLNIVLNKLNINFLTENSLSYFTALNDDKLLKVDVSLVFNNAHSLTLSAMGSQKSPDMFFYEYSGNNYFWSRSSYEKELTAKVELAYKWNDYLELTTSATNVKNMVWLDTDSKPFQTDKIAWLSQTCLSTNLYIGKFHWQTFNLLQFTSDDDVFRIPTFACKHSYFFDFNMFKKAMSVQAGIDLRYNTAFYADAYNPALAAFYRQNDVEIGDYLWADIFVSLQIKHATIFLKLLHINALWEQNPIYFMSPHYPGQDFTLQWGFVWKFFD